MAGRQDYGVLRSEFLTDARALAAAEAYTSLGLAREEVAFATVCGHIVQLGLWAMRETDDGVLPGDAVAVVRQATLMPASMCRTIIDTLRTAGLLRDVEGGVYLVGFNDCYDSILDRRETNANANRIARAKKQLEQEKALRELGLEPVKKGKKGRKQAVSVTSATRNTDVMLPSAPIVQSGAFVPDVPHRNGTDGTNSSNGFGNSHPAVSGGAALASEAAAAPPSAGAVERTPGRTVAALPNPKNREKRAPLTPPANDAEVRAAIRAAAAAVAAPCATLTAEAPPP